MSNKTIDDIINQSDIISALSTVPADVTNVETMKTFARQQPAYAQSQYSMREMEPQIVSPGLGFLEYAATPASASVSFLKSLLSKGSKEPLKLLTSGKRSSVGELSDLLGRTKIGQRVSKSDPMDFLSEEDKAKIARAIHEPFDFKTFKEAQSLLKKATDSAGKSDKVLEKTLKDFNELLKSSMPKSIPLPSKTPR